MHFLRGGISDSNLNLYFREDGCLFARHPLKVTISCDFVHPLLNFSLSCTSDPRQRGTRKSLLFEKNKEIILFLAYTYIVKLLEGGTLDYKMPECTCALPGKTSEVPKTFGSFLSIFFCYFSLFQSLSRFIGNKEK